MTKTREPEERARLHRNLVVIEVETAAHLRDLEAIPQVRAAMVRRLTPTLAVLDAARLPDLLAALEKHGGAPRVENADEGCA